MWYFLIRFDSTIVVCLTALQSAADVLGLLVSLNDILHITLHSKASILILNYLFEVGRLVQCPHQSTCIKRYTIEMAEKSGRDDLLILCYSSLLSNKRYWALGYAHLCNISISFIDVQKMLLLYWSSLVIYYKSTKE